MTVQENVQLASQPMKRPLSKGLILAIVVCLVIGGGVGGWLFMEKASQPQRRAKLKQMTQALSVQQVTNKTFLDWVTRMAPSAPTFVKPARSFAEWYRWPLTSPYSPSGNLWTSKDSHQSIQQLLYTGTPDSKTRARITQLLLAAESLSSVDNKASILGAGMLRFVFKATCKKNKDVRRYETNLAKLDKLFETVLKKPKGWQARFFKRFKKNLRKRAKQGSVRKYLACQERQAGTLRKILRTVAWFQSEVGLMSSHTNNHAMLEKVRKHWTLQVNEQVQGKLNFAQQLQKQGVKEAVSLFPMLHRRLRRKLSFSLTASNYEGPEYGALVSMLLKEWRKGVANLLDQQKQSYQQQIANLSKKERKCKVWKKQRKFRKTLVYVDEFCSATGKCRDGNAPDMSRFSYCSLYLPELRATLESRAMDVTTLRTNLVNRMGQYEDKLKGAVRGLIWDAMLRNVPLPLARNQRAFLLWRDKVRSHVWFKLYQVIVNQGLTIPHISNPNLVFQVRKVGDALKIVPFWVVDLKRSTLQWGRDDVLPRLSSKKLPSTYTGDITRSSARKDSFDALTSIHGTQTLSFQGKLFSKLSTFWKKSIPLKLALAPSSGKGRRSKQEDDFEEGKKQFARYQKLRRLDIRLLTLKKPNVAKLHLVAQSLERGSEERKRFQKALQALTLSGSRWTETHRHSIAHALYLAEQKRLLKIIKMFSPYIVAKTDSPGIRLLVSRCLFELGRYRASLRLFLSKKVPVGFYHPELTWKISTNWKGPIENLLADRIQNTVVVKASSNGPAQQPVMVLQGMSREMAKDLVTAVNKAPLVTYKKEKISDQILMLPVRVSSRIKQVFAHQSRTENLPLLLKDMVYSCQSPGVWLFPKLQRCSHPLFQPKRSSE